MKFSRLLKGATLSLACLGMLVPSTGAMAAGPKQAKTHATKVVDVAMKAGTVHGQILNAQGIALDGTVVSIRQGNKEVARTITDKNGKFAAKNLRSGVYQVVAGNTQSVYRVWAEKIAPPSAKPSIAMVSTSKAVRAQMCCGVDAITAITLGAAVTGVTLAAINLSKLNDLEDAVDDIPTSP